MSKHSHSFHINSQATQSGSFFDTISNSDHFWKKKRITDELAELSVHPVIIENEFRIRKKKFFQEWEAGVLTLRGNLLIYQKKKSPKYIEYVDFEENMYRMEIIAPGHKKSTTKYPHGFSLYANGKTAEFFCKEREQIFNWFCQLRKQCILTNFHENYRIAEVIGSGGYGKVNILESALDDGKMAGKFIKLTASSRDRQRIMIINEIRMLRKLDHPQIVKLFEVYEMAGQICLVMELIVGEKLFKYITGRKPLSEENTAYIAKQLLLILTYLKSHDIIHRDLKSENILYTLDEKGKIKLKVIDFGLGTYNKKRDIIKKCGTAGYVAPEILNNRPYSFKADLYSLGVIIYICLTGRPAFYARNYDELLDKNRLGIIKYKGNNWNRLSREAQDFVQRVLDPDPSIRISLSEALNHEWLYKKISPEDRKDLSEYMFKATKVSVPQEVNISKVPTSSGQIPFVNKTQALSEQTITSYQKGSHSFLTSKLALGIEDPKEINSFYKPGSRDLSYSQYSQLSIQGSHTSLSRSPSPNLGGGSKQLAPFPSRSLTVALPRSGHGSQKELMSRYLSLRHDLSGKPSAPSKVNKGYSIQVSGAVSLDDVEMQADDEGSFCSNRYEDLLRNPLQFVRIGDTQPQADSLDELKITGPHANNTQRTDSALETPRMKHKVAAMDKNVREQIQSGTQELLYL